jgi:hypothetical protein
VGDIKGGEGRSRQATTADLVRAVRAEAEDDGGVVERILIRAASPVLYAVQVWMRGDRDPEAFFVHLPDEPKASPTEPSVKGGPEEKVS